MTGSASCRSALSRRATRLRIQGLGWLWATWMRVQATTWRIRILGEAHLEPFEGGGGGVILVVWHGCYRALLAGVRGRPAAVLSTDTFRGRIIEAAAGRLGHRAVLRPPSLKGDAALDWMCRALESERRIVIVADGPSGPARRVKRGVGVLAARLGVPIVPCASAGRPVYIRERWDAQELPLPFARVAIVFGEALSPSAMGGDAASRNRVDDAIESCRTRARRAVGSAA